MKRNSNKKPSGGNPKPQPNDAPQTIVRPAGSDRPIFNFVGMGNAVLLSVVLFIVGVLTFLPALKGGFIDFDDPTCITANSHVNHGLTAEGLKWAFTSAETSNWHPLTWLSHMLDCWIFGLKPWGHHLTSVLLHAVNLVLLFLVLRRMTGATWRSLFVAAVFGLHPLRVESVAWISERKDVLSVLFWLLALWTYVRFAEESKNAGGKSKLFYGLTLLFFAFGLMSKPMLVTFPFSLLLLDYWPLGRIADLKKTEAPRFARVTLLRVLVEKIPFFLLAAVASVITLVAQKNAGAVITIGGLPFTLRAENVLVSYCRYLGKLLWPENLCLFYPLPARWPMAIVALCGALLAGITILALAWRRKRPYLPVGWFWFVGTLVPAIGLVQVGSQAMADRYSYMPSVGVLVLLTWGVCELTNGWRWRTGVLTVAGVAIVLACIGLTREQLAYWKDSETLFRRAVAVTRENFMAWNRLGSALYLEAKYDGAIEAYREAVKINPDFAEGQSNLGTSLVKIGRFDEAIIHLREAVRLQPGDVAAACNLGVALGSDGRVDEAISMFEQAVKLKPGSFDAHNNLGIALAQKDRLDEAIAQFQEAVRLDPNRADAKQNLAALMAKKRPAAKP